MTEAREAMAKALVLHEYGEGSWEAFDEREREAWREQVDTYFKLDPLRHLLGIKNVERILQGEDRIAFILPAVPVSITIWSPNDE